ncbi:hypothetical protein J1N35_044580 [Gossypium stocksii]|uniref:Uncharacterized protein n=1 Tax=Gossypium stocksii TaxID=47602 RepID=A0A9D3ZG95_9ROSI|nr:hypothetical protein J1N35_044580 [Gossypium stocksii]
MLRRRKNTIRSLRHDDGKGTIDKKEIKEIARNYFQHLFTSNWSEDTTHVFSGIERYVSEEVNSKWIENYTKEEIITTLKEIGPTKA